MRRFVAKRLAYLVPTAVLATIGVFLLQHLSRGGPAVAILGEHSTKAQIAAENKRLGLDHPLIRQYGTWLWDVLHGNLQTSYQSGEPVTSGLKHALPVTIEMALVALIIAVVVGIPLGLLAALRPGRPLDRAVRLLTGFGVAVPDFWAATLLIIVLAFWVHWFPATGFVPLGTNFGQSLRSIALPALGLSLPAGASMTRQARSVFGTVLESEFMVAATASGVPDRVRIGRYALKAAAPTLLTVGGLLASGILGGTVVVEVIFALPGVGSLIVQAATQHDYPTIQGVVLCFVGIVLVLNILVDTASLILDPRVRR